MGFKLYGWLIIISCAIQPLFVSGQKIRFYNSAQGLPNSLIHKVSQDSWGYIWIATENGASFFDGMRFTTFRHDKNKPGTLSSDLVKAIFTDSRGVTWIGTSMGLQIYDREKNIFREFPLQCPSFTGTPYVTSIIENRKNDKLLVSVAGFGIIVYDGETHQIDRETTSELQSLYKTFYPGTLFFDSDGFLWSFSEQGSFFKVNFEKLETDEINWSPALKDLAQKIVVSAITEDPVTRNILIGTYNHGIFIFDRGLGLIRKSKGKSGSKFRIRALLAETKKTDGNELNIWVGSEDTGLRKFSREQEEIIKPDFQYAPIDLENCKVHSIMQDYQGNIWAGIFQKGLLIIPRSSNDFEYIKLSDSQGSMSVNIACVTSITRDINGNLWVGTDGGGLFKVFSDGTKKRYTNVDTTLPNNAIQTIAADKRGTLWISTYMGGITTYNSQKGFEAYSNDIELQRVICSYYDCKKDKLYMGTLGHGVKVLSLENNKLETFPREDDLSWVNSLLIDSSDNLWVGKTSGISCFNTETGEELYTGIGEKLKEININSSLEDNDGSLWFGSPEGLFHIHPKENQLELYSKTDGLPGNIVCSFQQDKNGILWISTFYGLSRFDIHSKTFKNFYAYDGIQDNEFHIKASYVDNDGKMFFGGINGITAFYPEKIKGEEKLMSKLYFSQLTVLNKSINFDETLGKKNILDRHISQARQITLKKNQNVFTLEFNVLEYANPHKVIYGYMLKGFDNDWRYTSSNHRLATYTNLPEGSYVFHVKAFFEGCSDEENVVYNEINIRILPPWYKTFWAYLVYLALAMFAVWEFLNYLIRRKLRNQERLELEKKEMKLRMFTDLTHEIRTPFTLVMTPLKSMKDSETDSSRKEMFNLMYRNILRILRLLNQLMDIRKIDNHQLKIHFQKTDLVLFVKDIMNSFEQLAIMRNIDFRLVSNIEALEVWIDQVNFDKVLFNIFSNAFKFTSDNGYILISLDAIDKVNSEGLSNNVDGFVELSIENSGSKINEDEMEHIFDRFYQSSNNISGSGSGIGLHLAKMIVHMHHGKILAKNAENGVVFIIRIPLGNKHLSLEEIGLTAKNNNNYTRISNNEDYPYENKYIEMPQTDDDIVLSKGTKSKRKLIFIDDDADLGKYIRMALSDKYNVEVCNESREAWKIITTSMPDAVITDLVMLEVDGISLLKKIRQNPETNHLPVIIVTSQIDEESERLCFESGADHYITKPINLELLKSSITQVIQTREMIRNKYSVNVKPDFNAIRMTSPDNRLIAKVIETIKMNIENSDFSVDDLSRKVGLSRVHLNRKLKENINISPSNLIKSIRLKQAAYLLINNKVNISDVAYKVGFSSHSYFSNNFKEYFGMAPTEYVQRHTVADDKESISKLFEN
ncbi:MAG: response regulator [Prolixibacteraceae bacterium]|nr:response regulator [Prolixibacteraceae bacterium]